MHSLIFAFRDVNFFGLGIYLLELIFSCIVVGYYFLKGPLRIWSPVVNLLSLLFLIQVIWMVVFYNSSGAPISIISGPTVNILFAISLYLHLNSNKFCPNKKRYFIFIFIYLLLNIVYWVYEMMEGAGQQNIFHVRLGDPVRTRMLNTEPSYIYTPLFIIGTLFAYFFSKPIYRYAILFFIFFAIFTTGAKTFIVVFLLSGIVIAVNKGLFSKNLFYASVVIPCVCAAAFYNESIKLGLIDPLLASGSDFILEILKNNDSENVGSFQTRILSLYGGVMTFIKNPVLGVGPNSEHIFVAQNILNEYFFNLELIDASIHNEFAITSKGYVISGLASYGLIWFLIWSLILRSIVKNEHLSEEIKFMLAFLFFSSLITEGTNYPALVVLICTYIKLKKIDRLQCSKECV
jgi:hypothetical protein